MDFKLDENLPVEAAEHLQARGHDAVSVVDQNMQGSSDSQIANVCHAEQRILVTLDMDFADIRAYPPEEYSGIIVLRPSTQAITAVVRLLERVALLLDTHSVTGQLWLVDEFRVRMRGPEADESEPST